MVVGVPSDLAAVEAGVDALARAAWDPPPGPAAGEALLRLGRAVERLTVLRAVWAERFEAGGAWAGDGARSGAAWTAARAVEHPATARARVHAGRDLLAVPTLAAAAVAGHARLGHVRALVTAARARPHRWARLADVEPLAVDTAARVSEHQFDRFVARWAALVDAEHDQQLRDQGIAVPVGDGHATQRDTSRELHLSRFGTQGMWALTGTLDPETGAALAAALESICQATRADQTPRGPGGTTPGREPAHGAAAGAAAGPARTLAQLRHDALGVLLDGQLSAGLPVHKGIRPHLLAVVHLDTPESTGTQTGAGCGPGAGAGPRAGCGPGTRPDPVATALADLITPANGWGAGRLAAPTQAELLDRTDTHAGRWWLTGHTLQRIACDALIQALLVDSNGQPLRLGRAARVVPPHLRRIIDLRDRHCVFAGCTAPAIWCQAHHLTPWEDTGPTDERNLALTCGYHHKLIHEHGYQLRWNTTGTTIETLRPDQTPIRINGQPARS